MDSELTLRTGVVLELRHVGAMVLWEAGRRILEPKPPKAFIVAKGREEENLDDPEYLSALADYRLDLARVMGDAYLMFGSRLKFVPVDFPKPEDPEWVEDLRYIGIEMPPSAKARYALWVRMIATEGDTSELRRLTDAIGDQVTVSEEAVAAAAESFRLDEGRGVPVGKKPKRKRSDRNKV